MVNRIVNRRLLWLVPCLVGTTVLIIRSASHFFSGSHSLQQVFIFLTALLTLGLLWALGWYWQQATPPLKQGLLLTFGLSMFVRILLVCLTPMSSHFADTCLVMDSGSVMSHDVRPYDHTDKVALRNKLRTDNYAFLPPMAGSPAEWNYHTSSHLPLGMLFYGTFDVWWPNVWGYRLGFSVLDSLLGCFAYWWLWLMIPALRRTGQPTGLLNYLKKGMSGQSI